MAQIATPRLGAGRQTGLGAAPRPPIRPPGRRGRVAARAQRGGVAVVHIFENLRKPALFDSFLEGMTHVIEVSRYHPNFRNATVHTCIDQEALGRGAPFSYLNFTVFGTDEEIGSLEQLAAPHTDWTTSMEFGHDGQVHYPLVMREVDSTTNGTDGTPLQQALNGEFSCKQDDVVVVVATEESQSSDTWRQWSGADKFAQRADFRSASLYEAVDSGAKYKYVMRAEFQNLGDVDLNSLAESLAEINEGPQDTVAIAYRSLIQVEKGGSPTDLLFAERAKADKCS